MSKSSHVASGAKTIEETVSPGAPYVVPTKLRPQTSEAASSNVRISLSGCAADVSGR